MRAVVLREPGPPEHLVVEADWPRPVLRPGCAIVQVEAEGVCYRDVVERRGGFPFIRRPVVPGHEFAGTIVELADDVEHLAVGQRVVNLHRAPCGSCRACTSGNETRCQRALEVFGLSVDGGYAELVLARAGCLVPIPAGIPSEHACFLNCTAGVACIDITPATVTKLMDVMVYVVVYLTGSMLQLGAAEPWLMAPLLGWASRPEYAPFAQQLVENPPRPGGRIVDDSKVHDHHAIIPTTAAPRGTLDRDETRVFDLIVRRWVSKSTPTMPKRAP